MHPEGKIISVAPFSSQYPNLFKPGYIGALRIKNRIIKAPTLTCFAAPDGSVTDRLVRHYKELACGGTGLIMVEYTYVDDDASQSGYCQLSLANNTYRPGMEWLASTIKANGAAACLQLVHAGRQKFIGTPPLKTAIRYPWEELYAGGAPIPEQITCEEIHELVGNFGDAALRAQQVGFDMIEIHAAHGYLLTNFLSPKNKRPDWYGGSLTNRMRILIEIVADIRNKVGLYYPISIRLSGKDYEDEDPITIEESLLVAKALEKAGVDIIHVSGGDHHTMHYEVSPSYMPTALHVRESEKMRQALDIPVIASGSITTPDQAEEILKGSADFISLGRPLLADPFWSLKAQQGRSDCIRPCIRCNECISERGHGSNGLVCSVNPALGKEGFFDFRPTEAKKRVCVIGGGPAGLEVARVAALRGHDVTLYEKKALGGRLIEASAPDFKASLRRLIDYLRTQLEETGVRQVNEEFTPAVLQDADYDTVIIATGGLERLLEVPGADGESILSYLEVLKGAETGEKVVVIGGGLGGCDVAQMLAAQGKKVAVVDILEEIGAHMNQAEKNVVFGKFEEYAVELHPGRLISEILDDGVQLQDRFGRKEVIESDTVVAAIGFTPNLSLFEELAGNRELEVFAIGDCVQARKVFDAIHEGWWVGFQI